MDNDISLTKQNKNTQAFEESLQEAEFLISHASKLGKVIPEELLSSVMEAKQAAQNGMLTPKLETTFWLALTKLSQIADPVSVASIKAATVRSSSSGKRFTRFIKKILHASDADLAEYEFRFWAVGVVILLLSCQIYWLVGVNIIKKIDRLEGETTIKAAPTRPGPLRNDNLNPDGLSIPENANIDIKQKSLDLNASYEFLYKLNYPVSEVFNLDLSHLLHGEHLEHSSDPQHLNEKHFVFVDNPGDKDLALKILTIDLARLVLDTLNFFFLPILYGLMGATAYVLRKLSHEIETVTYTPQSNVRYRLRMTLGAMSGLAIVWLFHPSSILLGETISNEGNGVIGIFDSLSPLALAFIAGYSVEVLFSLMDAAILKFTVAPPSKNPN